MTDKRTNTLSDQSVRDLSNALRAIKTDFANLKRRMATYEVRRHESRTAPPGIEQVALAEFRAHTSPNYEYPYPLPEDENEDNVFPAFIQRLPDFVDDPEQVTPYPFAEQQEIIWPENHNFHDQTDPTSNGEPAFVYSLRNTYIPPNPSSGDHKHRVLPVFKINGKWYCDYQPQVRLTVMFADSSEAYSLTAGSSGYFDAVVQRLYEGVGIGPTTAHEQYSPIQVDDDGIFTAYRKMCCFVTFSATITFSTPTPLSASLGKGVFSTEDSTAAVYMGDCWFTVPAPINHSSGSAFYDDLDDVKISCAMSGAVVFDVGETLKFKLDNDGSNATTTATDVIVTLTSIENTLSYY